MKNWKVSTRLYAAFGVVLAFLMISTWLGISRMQNINERLHEIADINDVETALLHKMKSALYERRIITRNIIVVTDASDMQREVENMKVQEGIYTDAKAKLGQMLATLQNTTAEEKTAFANLDKYEAPANAAMAKVAKLGLANANEEATKVMFSEVKPAQAVWATALIDFVALEEKLNDAAIANANTAYQSALYTLIALGAAATVIGATLAFFITRQLVGQLGGEPNEVTHIVEEIAAGNLSIAAETRPGDQQSLLFAVKSMRDSLAEIVRGVRNNSEGVAVASAQIAQGNNDLSSRTEEQASALEETAASMEQLGSTVRQNADNAKQANQLAMSASTVATQGGDVVGRVVDTMKGINESSRKIGDIISVIDGIAFQTNILALNAAVEAARAGEQGRGFAVVASEVRSLAQRSAEAAKEIKTLISVSVERVDQGTELVDQARTTMTEIVGSIRRVADIMGEISAASNEQSAGVTQVGEAVTQMDQATQQNAALVEESAAAAESLKSQAQQLVQSVASFKLGGQSHAAVRTANPSPATKPVDKAAAPAERRSPDRAKNVVRPKFASATTSAKPEPKADPVSPAQSVPVAAEALTGSDDWTSF
ncbi:methyl-accepting chemotaxis protein [soil metagenome]